MIIKKKKIFNVVKDNSQLIIYIYLVNSLMIYISNLIGILL